MRSKLIIRFNPSSGTRLRRYFPVSLLCRQSTLFEYSLTPICLVKQGFRCQRCGQGYPKHRLEVAVGIGIHSCSPAGVWYLLLSGESQVVDEEGPLRR